MSAIALADVTLKLGGRTILDGVSLSIREGEFVGVLGPNGAGKTTLMRAVVGLLAPAAGHISVLDKPARRGNPAVGYLPQVRTTLSDLRLTGRDFVAAAINGPRLGLPILSSADRVALGDAFAAVGAEGLARRPVSEMSGGERQRLLLAQALLGKPKILLLDEPLISLDPRRQQEIVDLAARLCRELGLTVLFSAHELSQLLGAIDRVLYLGGGHAALGTVDKVITGPVLSRLYGTHIDVVRAGSHIFVLSDSGPIEGEAHPHEHGHGHKHGDHPAHGHS